MIGLGLSHLAHHLGLEEEDGNDEVKAMREVDELEPWALLVYRHRKL